MKPEAFLPSNPSKGACLQHGHRRRRSGLPGEFTPMAGPGRRAEVGGRRAAAGSQMSEGGPSGGSNLKRLLELFAFYDGRVPGFELTAEGFAVHRLERDRLIFHGNPFDFGCYRLGPELENMPPSPGRNRSIQISKVNDNLTLTKQNKHEDKP